MMRMKMDYLIQLILLHVLINVKIKQPYCSHLPRNLIKFFKIFCSRLSIAFKRFSETTVTKVALCSLFSKASWNIFKSSSIFEKKNLIATFWDLVYRHLTNRTNNWWLCSQSILQWLKLNALTYLKKKERQTDSSLAKLQF
jgi:hypothetical protein